MKEDGLSPGLQSLINLLWPSAIHDVALTRRRSGAGDDQYLVLPSPGRPRVLVPLSSTSATTAALATSLAGGGSWAPLVRQAAVLVARTGAAAHLPIRRLQISTRMRQEEQPPTLRASLSNHLDENVASMGIRVGTDRLNQKPVLQLLDVSGTALAFAKIGANPLTRELVKTEDEALRTLSLAGSAVLRAPKTLGLSRWRDLNILLQEPLDIPHAAEPSPPMVASSLIELRGLGSPGAGPLADNTYMKRLLLDPAADSGPRRRRLAELVARIHERHGDVLLQPSASHGDFRPWNVAADGERLLAWDWERFQLDSITGLDAVHWHHPSPRPGESSVDYNRRLRQATASAQWLLEALGIDQSAHETIETIHLVVIVRRQLDDIALVGRTTPHDTTDQLLTTIANRLAH